MKLIKHRQFVAQTIAPFVTAPVIESLRADLREKDWRSVGAGEWSCTNNSRTILVRQTTTDLDRFEIEITE